MRSTIASWISFALTLSWVGVASPGDRSARARELIEDAERRLAIDDFDQRRIGLQDLEQAAVLEPRDPQILDALGRAYLDAGFLHLASGAFGRELRHTGDRAPALLGLGRVEARDWLETGDHGALVRALQRLDEAMRVRPDYCEARIVAAALRFENGDAAGARRDALRALAAAPERADARLAAAYLAYRAGQVAFADSLFAVTVPALSPAIAAHFADITPLLTREGAEKLAAMEAGARAEAVRRFWIENDPDPTSAYNLARLEFWSRMAHAITLLGNPWSTRWVGRTELYCRYGRKVQIEDSKASRHYEMPWLELGEEASQPSPEALASLGQLTTSGGRAVFAPLPPGARELPLAWTLARFEGSGGARLVAAIGTRGSPSDSLMADCAVLDRDEHPIARASATLAPSACDPTGLREAELSFDLPPGLYRVAFAVRDGHGGCGLKHTLEEVGARSSELSMSDVVVTCGLPDPASGQHAVRLDPNLSSRVEAGEPLRAYFEVYRLHTDAKGWNQFEYEYTVYALDRYFQGPRGLLSFHTSQDGVGPMRRQFIRVPVETLVPGRYRLAITVRDLSNGAEVGGSADFEKPGPASVGAASTR